VIADRLLVLETGAESNTERLESVWGGINLFLAQPIFGAGLGTFMESKVQTGKPLVIHSTPIWLLAEFGLVGFAVFLAAAFTIVRTQLRKFDATAKFLLLAFLAFAVVSTVHEILYQRAFWLLVGAGLATPIVRARFTEDSQLGRV
jgi:O-antigen ligase